MGYMILEYEFVDNAYAELYGRNIKFWLNTGLPDYEGSLEGFAKLFPKHFAELLTIKIIKKNLEK